MLTISPLTSVRNERESLQMQGFSMDEVEFPEFSSGNLLDSIDFDDIFVGISDGDVLPDLEMDGEIRVDFSVSAGEESEAKMASVFMEDENRSGNSENPAAESGSDVGFGSFGVIQGEEVVSKSEESVANNSSRKNSGKNRKSSSHSKNPTGKKKSKVDWSPDLHRRFVQAVEQLGLDKAVPSRILEIMGNDSLTRHNIASHLQKYRSHRKHLLAREAEAASWSQRRQMYAAPPIAGGPAKRDQVNPWIAPTMGFPPVAPMPHFRPLHVWGHPSVDQSLMPMWPNHVAPPTPTPHAWPAPHPLPPSPPADPSFWHSHGQYVSTTGTPWFPPHMPPMRFQSPPVAGVPPPAMYKVEPGVPAPQTLPKPAPSDVLPSKESIDAAIGDVLTKPWLPLPLGLKPPSLDSVMTELQRQGVSNVPRTCS